MSGLLLTDYERQIVANLRPSQKVVNAQAVVINAVKITNLNVSKPTASS